MSRPPIRPHRMPARVTAAARLSEIRRALLALRAARLYLRMAGAGQAHAAVCRALKSTEGAERHAYGRVLRVRALLGSTLTIGRTS